jgi:hypothetical protein
MSPPEKRRSDRPLQCTKCGACNSTDTGVRRSTGPRDRWPSAAIVLPGSGYRDSEMSNRRDQPAAGSSIKVVGAAHSTKASAENVASSTPATVAATKNSDIATQTTTGAATTARPARNTNEQWYAPPISASPRSCTDRGLRSHVCRFQSELREPLRGQFHQGGTF